MDVKHCPTCDITRDTSDFTRNRSRPDGLHGECRWCHTDRTAAWKAAHPEARRRMKSEWQKRKYARLRAQRTS